MDNQPVEGDLLGFCLTRFDELQAADKLFYAENTSDIVTHNGFTMQFSLVTAFTQKPLPGKTNVPTARPDPFGQPEPGFVMAETATHLLQLNKYNAVRPQLIVHPKAYAPQTDPLSEQDFTALLDIRDRLASGGGARHVVFYNCRPESGSSQPYKHMQIIPKPDPASFTLFPDRPEVRSALVAAGPRTPVSPPKDSHVPFTCLVAGISKQGGDDISASGVHSLYMQILAHLQTSTGCTELAHNMIMTDDWICVVPRRSSGWPLMANALGFMGMVWVASQEERDAWTAHGLSAHLVELGFPASA